MQDGPPAGRVARGAARRERLAHAALEILGERGMHALTHRAVDAALGLPAGSCSFSHGTRHALVVAAADRLSALDRDDLVAVQDASGRIDVLELMRRWTAPHARTRLLARLELYLTAMREPDVHARVLENRTFFLERAEAALAAKGAADAVRSAAELLSLVDGELLRAAMFAPGEPYAPAAAFGRELSRYR